MNITKFTIVTASLINWMSSEISFSAGALDPQHCCEKAIGGSNLEWSSHEFEQGAIAASPVPPCKNAPWRGESMVFLVRNWSFSGVGTLSPALLGQIKGAYHGRNLHRPCNTIIRIVIGIVNLTPLPTSTYLEIKKVVSYSKDGSFFYRQADPTSMVRAKQRCVALAR